MRTIVQSLLTLQDSLLRYPTSSAEHRIIVERLREHVPAPVLAHFLRCVEQGHRGVAVVRHGVCTECHLRLPSAQTAMLAKPDGLHLCENCGCYLFLPDDEISALQHQRLQAKKMAARRCSQVATVT